MARLEGLCFDLFMGTLDSVEKAIREAKMNKSSIYDIILVSDSTRRYKAQRLLHNFINDKGLYKSINPDEAEFTEHYGLRGYSTPMSWYQRCFN